MKQLIILIWWSFIYLVSKEGPYLGMEYFTYQILISLILICGYIVIGIFSCRTNLIQLVVLTLLTASFALFNLLVHLEWIRGGDFLYDMYKSVQGWANIIELSVILFNSGFLLGRKIHGTAFMGL